MKIPFLFQLKFVAHKPFLFFLLLFISLSGYAQIFPEKYYPVDYFIYPVKNVRISLSANFGELRRNHFHMGLDCRTDQAVNKRVVAAADGYVSRISIAPFGYGHAIYINHPNGLTTVYGHLNKFYPELEAYLEIQQYRQESWAINLNLDPEQFPVKQGQFIAYSGSTGGSGGPHLHFEIRDTKTSKVLNPLLFNFPIPDDVRPTVRHMYMYDRCKSTYAQKPTHVYIRKVGGNKYETNQSIVPVHTDKISFAITAYDTQTGSSNPNGIYQAEIYFDGVLQSAFQLDSISYDETRYLNAHIDYKTRAGGGPYLQHLSRLPGNPEYPDGIYKDFAGDGVIELNDRAVHDIKIVVKDQRGNSSEIIFRVQKGIIHEQGKEDKTPDQKEFFPGYVNIFEEEGMQIYLDENALYDSLTFFYNKKPAASGAWSSTYAILSPDIPVHNYYTLRLRPDKQVPTRLREKMLIRNSSNGSKDVRSARFENGWFTARFNEFGDFTLICDTIPPEITGGFANNANLSGRSSIVFVPKDGNGATRNFRAELDGKWLMFSNDKGRRFIYRFDEHCPAGPHELTITVEDAAGNQTKKILRFTR